MVLYLVLGIGGGVACYVASIFRVYILCGVFNLVYLFFVFIDSIGGRVVIP